MNLVCFPHYTCGGLLVDILSDTFSAVNPNTNGIKSARHNLGKIGDSATVLTEFDTTRFINKLINLKLQDNEYVGTHCWPGNMDLSPFNHVICVTTMTYRSRIYRWARAFNHYYLASEPWQLSGMELVDKQRETAKNYLIPFRPVTGATNIEFSEIVDNTLSFQQLVKEHDFQNSVTRWREINKFLYSVDFWQSTPVQRYYEAEFETTLDQSYIYE